MDGVVAFAFFPAGDALFRFDGVLTVALPEVEERDLGGGLFKLGEAMLSRMLVTAFGEVWLSFLAQSGGLLVCFSLVSPSSPEDNVRSMQSSSDSLEGGDSIFFGCTDE